MTALHLLVIAGPHWAVDRHLLRTDGLSLIANAGPHLITDAGLHWLELVGGAGLAVGLVAGPPVADLGLHSRRVAGLVADLIAGLRLIADADLHPIAGADPHLAANVALHLTEVAQGHLQTICGILQMH